ncbi:MAG: hypothetical protein AVDCRST_MAG02-3020, partial [uncultured Rubrobacteraceae bacterium]
GGRQADRSGTRGLPPRPGRAVPPPGQGHRTAAAPGGGHHRGARGIRVFAGRLAAGRVRAGGAAAGGGRGGGAGPVRPGGRTDAARGPWLPALAPAGVVAGGDLAGDGRGGVPVALRRVQAGLRVPDHGLRRPDDPVPQRPRRARRLLPRGPGGDPRGTAGDGL